MVTILHGGGGLVTSPNTLTVKGQIMSSNKWAIEQTIRVFFNSIGNADAIIYLNYHEEYESNGMTRVNFSLNHQVAFDGIVVLQGQYHDQPGFLFLDARSMYVMLRELIVDSFNYHKSDYPHSIGM